MKFIILLCFQLYRSISTTSHRTTRYKRISKHPPKNNSTQNTDNQASQIVQKMLETRNQLVHKIDQQKIDQQQKQQPSITPYNKQQRLTKLKQQQQVGLLKMRFKSMNRLKTKSMNMNMNMNQLDLNNQIQLRTQTNEKIQNAPALVLRNWMKFVEQNPMGPKQMDFFINNNFFDQAPNEESDDSGPMCIPDPFHFFFVITNEYMFVLANRNQELTSSVLSMPIKKLIPVGEGPKGGVEDVGDFQEGFCFKLSFMVSGKKQYVLCADSAEIKKKWMSDIISAKQTIDLLNQNIQQQQGDPKEEGDAVIKGYDSSGDAPKPAAKEGEGKEGEAKGKEGEAKEGEGKEGGSKEGGEEGGGQKVDGKWVQLQDWSSCTMACGGGTQTLHRVCKPPENGGKECEGEAILTRPCNEQPCPAEEGAAEGEGALPPGATGKEKIKNNDPKVKLIRVSDQYQIYERCLVKDTDIEVVQDQLKQFQVKPRLPGRAIMNNRTFSVFMRKNLNSAVFSVPLNHIEIQEYNEEEECFKIKDKATSLTIILCGLRSAKQPLMEIKQRWIEDIKFFKNNCFKALNRKKLPPKNLDDPLLDLKQGELDKAKGEAAAEEEEASKNSHQDNSLLKEKFKEMQEMAEEAIKKEMKYEDLLEMEQKQKEKDEQTELALQLEKLNNKKECVSNAAEKEEMKEADEDKNVEMLKSIDEVKDSIKCMIIKKRQQKKQQLEKMARLSGMRKKDFLSKIQSLRTSVAADVLKSRKKGDMNLCAAKEEKAICQYCEANFKEDAQMMLDCKEEENFCWVCCENEFGSIYLKERKKCQQQCTIDDSEKGNWVWVPSTHK